jgi:hypothetical protein
MAARVPFERILIPSRDGSKELEKFYQGLAVAQTGKKVAQGEGVAQGGSKGIITREGIDAERLGWQEDIALGQIWLLEGHLKNNCLGCGGDVECCWKHSDYVRRAADETLSMTTDPFWQNLKTLALEIRSKAHPDDVRRGTYAAEYPGLAVRLSEFRIALQKKAMERARPQLTLEEAKKLAAEEAAKEVEKKWQFQQKK